VAYFFLTNLGSDFHCLRSFSFCFWSLLNSWVLILKEKRKKKKKKNYADSENHSPH